MQINSFLSPEGKRYIKMVVLGDGEFNKKDRSGATELKKKHLYYM